MRGAVGRGAGARLRSFTFGSGIGLIIDIGGFWALTWIGFEPGVANLLSSFASIVVVYVFVTRRTFVARLDPVTFVLFLLWYSLNIAVVSLVIQLGSTHLGHRPIVWKLGLVPVSFVANYFFNVVLDRARRSGKILRLTDLAKVAATGVVGAVLLLPLGTGQPAAASAPTPAQTVSAAVAGTGVTPLSRMVQRLKQRATGTVTIGGLGSSVGAGAALPDPARQAPVAVFARALQLQVDPTSHLHWVTANGSVNGSTIHDGVSRDWAVLREQHPDVVVLAYGMNDGAPAQFNSGETFPGAMQDLRSLIASIREAGAVPVITTSPHPDLSEFNWDGDVEPLLYPAPGQPVPVGLRTAVIEERASDGTPVRASSRHAAVNEGMRTIAVEEHVGLIDAERSWFDAVASQGEEALFSDGEFVHPDLLGHRLSYGVAIRAWLASELLGTGPVSGWVDRPSWTVDQSHA